MIRRLGPPLVALALAACGVSVPLPKTGPHLGDDPIVVPTPPPPGKVEVISPPPDTMKKPVWIDGEWEWSVRRWQWKDGHWEEPPEGAYYAPPLTVRLADGSLAHFPGKWKTGVVPK